MAKTTIPLLHRLFPILQVRAEIKRIERERFGNYKGNLMKGLKVEHKELRKLMGARSFLGYLQQLQAINPLVGFPKQNYVTNHDPHNQQTGCYYDRG